MKHFLEEVTCTSQVLKDTVGQAKLERKNEREKRGLCGPRTVPAKTWVRHAERGFYKEYAVPGQGLWNTKCRKGWQGLVYDES